MARNHGVSPFAYVLGVVLLTQLGTACGLVDSGDEGAGGSGGSSVGAGGRYKPPWPDGNVEGCGSPTYDATSFCYPDCPDYDPIRAGCDAACVGTPGPPCIAVPSSGGAGPGSECTSLGGLGGDGCPVK